MHQASAVPFPFFVNFLRLVQHCTVYCLQSCRPSRVGWKARVNTEKCRAIGSASEEYNNWAQS